MTPCSLCPRKCGSIRPAGVCRSIENPVVMRAAPHYGEEPVITGTMGSGAVFFAGCNLHCVFCQNHEISHSSGDREGKTPRELADIFLRLQDDRVHNINLVTGTHYADKIAEALSLARLSIPVVWNSSGYESVETLKRLDGLVDVYLPDFKFSDSALAAKYCHAPDYPETALEAIKEMYRQVGEFEVDDYGIMRKGLLIRHLVLPGSPENTLGVIDRIEDNLPAKKIMFSLMAQYTPMPGLENYPELQRRVTKEEYDRCLSYLDFSEIENGFTQEPEAATDEMIPDFDGTGVN